MSATIALTFASIASHAADTADVRKACESLKGQMVGGASLVDTTLVTPTSGAGGDFCKVNGKIHGTLNFEIHMPVQWNQKLIYAGGGGFNGFIHPLTLSPSGNSGYALVASDGGHKGSPFDASWALNNPQAQQEYADLSVHTVLQAANAIVEKHYRSSVERRYFEGCSNGGREALISATRFPHDFDGIVARAPAWNFTKLFLAFNRNVKQQLGAAGGALTAANLTTLGDAITAKCDTLDGLKDGVVSNLAACKFDVAVLRCKGEKNDRCLSAEQIETVNTYFSPAKFADGTTYYPGWRPSGVEGMPEGLGAFLIAAVPQPGARGQLMQVPVASPGHSNAQGYLLQAGLLGNFLLGDPQYDTLEFKPEDHLSGINLLSTMLDATPDLSTFFALGHKLILWHGTGDAAISDKASIQYFDAVAGAVGGADVRDASMEFFLAPGVAHCSGGPGPDTVELLAPLAAWVEGGQRPSASKLVARKVDVATGAVAASRPVCRYPAYPSYVGRGDPNSAESFVCKLPADGSAKNAKQ
jgi:feruloyl esterase